MSKKTVELINQLSKRYVWPSQAFISEFRGGTGWERESRADALAMELWPSAGLELIGFEIKTSRQDWLRELKNPDKCKPIKQFCDRWYLVVSDLNIVKMYNDELPKDWGLMYLDYSGKIIVEKEAPLLKPINIDKLFLASLMRLASRTLQEVFIDGKKYIVEK